MISIDIDCHASGYDFIEMRDGNSKDSPLMGSFCGNSSDVPAFMQTTQNFLRIRWGFATNYFGSGLGFQIKYESSNVSQRMNYRFRKCGGYFTTPNGTLESPSYPDKYPDDSDCVYIISQPSGTIIVLSFHSIDIEYDSTCSYDYLEIRDGSLDGSPVLDKLCGNELPPNIISSQNHVLMR